MRRVVVSGAGVVSPIGVGIQEFYSGLRHGRAGVGAITHFDARAFPTRVAAEVRQPLANLGYDPSPRSAMLERDRKGRFGVIAAREAVAMAFGPSQPAGCSSERLGLSVAAGLELLELGGMMPYLAGEQIDGGAFLDALEQHASNSGAPLCPVGAIPADLGARAIRAEIGAAGPYSVNLSACAAGTQAIGEAFLAIREGAADVMLAGGYDSMVNPLGVGGFCLLEAMTQRNDLGPRASRPFDVSRDGFVLGEGAAFFVLEERERAVRRGARLVAELEGYGSSLDAYRVTDPHPLGLGATAAMNRALAMAGVAPRDLDYVNAHGTGTPKNDPVESRALHQVLGTEVDRVFVSSTKSQIGHLIGAAGAVEFAACLFALGHQVLPATISLSDPDPECRLRHVPVAGSSAEVRRALSNSFGFGGQNASIVVARPDL